MYRDENETHQDEEYECDEVKEAGDADEDPAQPGRPFDVLVGDGPRRDLFGLGGLGGLDRLDICISGWARLGLAPSGPEKRRQSHVRTWLSCMLRGMKNSCEASDHKESLLDKLRLFFWPPSAAFVHLGQLVAS
jgi:hypothetical protein